MLDITIITWNHINQKEKLKYNQHRKSRPNPCEMKHISKTYQNIYTVVACIETFLIEKQEKEVNYLMFCVFS